MEHFSKNCIFIIVSKLELEIWKNTGSLLVGCIIQPRTGYFQSISTVQGIKNISSFNVF